MPCDVGGILDGATYNHGSHICNRVELRSSLVMLCSFMAQRHLGSITKVIRTFLPKISLEGTQKGTLPRKNLHVWMEIELVLQQHSLLWFSKFCHWISKLHGVTNAHFLERGCLEAILWWLLLQNFPALEKFLVESYLSALVGVAAY